MNPLRRLLLCTLFLLAPSSHAADAGNGAYGGYVGSDAWFRAQTDSARQRAQMESLSPSRSGNARAGAEITLAIQFPAEQRGLANIMTVVLLPLDGGAHAAEALARVDRARQIVNATFIAKKGVLPGHAYQVVVQDARSGRYPVGRIRLEPGARSAHYQIAAPLLGASNAAPAQAQQPNDGTAQSEPDQRPQTGASYQPPQTGPGYQTPQTGPGFIAPQAGPGYVRPGSQ